MLKVFWIICGVIWAVVILGFIGLCVFNRIKNRRRRDDK